MKQASFNLDSLTNGSVNNNSTSKPRDINNNTNSNNSNTNNSNNTITSIKPKKLVENIYYFQ